MGDPIRPIVEAECKYCKGSGQSPKTPSYGCLRCKGTGRVASPITLEELAAALRALPCTSNETEET